MEESSVFQDIEKGKYKDSNISKESIKKLERQGEREKQYIKKTGEYIKEKSKVIGTKAKQQLLTHAKRIASGTSGGHVAKGIRRSVRSRANAPEEVKVIRPLSNPMPYHLEMRQPRDNGFRPHEPRSLVKEPDIEGYSRNLLLQPAKNIWEEPRKANVWDATFSNMKKKSIFESNR